MKHIFTTSKRKMNDTFYNCVVLAVIHIVMYIYINHYNISCKMKRSYLSLINVCLIIPPIEELVYRVGVIHMIDLFTTNTDMYWISHSLFAMTHIIPSTMFNYSDKVTNVYVVFGVLNCIKFIQVYHFGRLFVDLMNEYGIVFVCMFHSLFDIVIATIGENFNH